MGRYTPPPERRPQLVSAAELEDMMERVRAEEFGNAIGGLVRAIDVWANGEPAPPAWALEAQTVVVRMVEEQAERNNRP